MIFSFRIIARLRTYSFDTNRLPAGSAAADKVDFPPGAAHKSSIRTGASGNTCRNTCSRNMEDASCT
jgi:hypothetical protein